MSCYSRVYLFPVSSPLQTPNRCGMLTEASKMRTKASHFQRFRKNIPRRKSRSGGGTMEHTYMGSTIHPLKSKEIGLAGITLNSSTKLTLATKAWTIFNSGYADSQLRPALRSGEPQSALVWQICLCLIFETIWEDWILHVCFTTVLFQLLTLPYPPNAQLACMLRFFITKHVRP